MCWGIFCVCGLFFYVVCFYTQCTFTSDLKKRIQTELKTWIKIEQKLNVQDYAITFTIFIMFWVKVDVKDYK